MWTIIGLACMIGICYFDYSRIGKYGKLLTGGWIVVMGLSLFMGAVYINGAAYGILFLFGRVLPLRPFLYLIVLHMRQHCIACEEKNLVIPVL